MTNPMARQPVLLTGIPAIVLAGALCIVSPAVAQDSEALLNASLQAQAQTGSSAQRSQATVTQLAEQSSEYFGEYRVAVQRLDQLKVYNSNLERLLADQEQERTSLRDQLDNFGDIEQGIVPLMYELVASLKSFVELDMPFLQNERRDRVDRLEANLERSDLTVSEKYRQIMEAYQIETAYGRNIETYAGTLPIDGEDRKVDLLRIGRVVLAYQTPDQSRTGYWDKTTGQWTSAGDDYRRAVTEGIRIARKQAAPSLLELPLPAAEVAR